MTHSKEILLLATKLEKIALTKILSQISNLYKREVAPTMPTREESDAAYGAELQSFATNSDKMTAELTTAVRDVHEASRAQRDIEIINAGRKKLMKSCLDASVFRIRKLERQIEAMENTPE